MIPFNPTDPFPLLPWGSYAYSDAQAQAQKVDDFLGFRIDDIEKQISGKNAKNGDQQNWRHLSAQAFQTPYLEIRSLLEILKPTAQDHVVDLGAAYGRMGFVLARHFPEVKFTGFELELLRVVESQRVFNQNSSLIQFHQADLTDVNFHLPSANIYFIFDYGSEKAVSKTLHDLKMAAQENHFRVVARGRLSRFLIHRDHAWLCQVNPPRHFDHFSIFQS